MSKAYDTIIQIKNFFIHLRLKFNLFLTPIYLYGIVIANGNIFTWKFVTQFIIIHVFLYGGVNALNDYYDRDEQGPIGGLQSPPSVKGHSLFYLAWIWKLIGLYLSVRCSSSYSFTLNTLVCIVMSVAYSHPNIRLKSSPLASAILVILLQGFSVYYFGAVDTRDSEYDMSSCKFWIGAFVIMLYTFGSYLLSQVYQIEQDSRQGDRTLAIVLGVDKTLRLYYICSLIGGIGNSFLFGYYYQWWKGGLIFLYSLLSMYGVRRWERKFERQTVLEKFRSFHRILAVHTICLYFFYIGHFIETFRRNTNATYLREQSAYGVSDI